MNRFHVVLYTRPCGHKTRCDDCGHVHRTWHAAAQCRDHLESESQRIAKEQHNLISGVSWEVETINTKGKLK